MNRKYIKIKEFIIDNKDLIISDSKNYYYLKCNNGSVETPIKNCEGKLVGINYICKNDLIHIKYIKDLNSNKKIIKKIYIKTKYDFLSESSDDLDLF